MSLEGPVPPEQWRDPTFEDLVRFLCTKTGMVVNPPTFASVCIYLDGFDAGRGGGPLLSFREWLVVRFNGGDNLHWRGLAESLMPEDQDEKNRIRDLGELIGEFLSYRTDHGVTKVFYDYGKWLLRQKWYRGPLRREKGGSAQSDR